MATRSDANCNISYYGLKINDNLDEASDITKPLLLHIAGADQFTSAEARALIVAELGGNPLVTLHTYPGASHGFARTGSQYYHQEAANLANRRSIAFLEQYLCSKHVIAKQLVLTDGEDGMVNYLVTMLIIGTNHAAVSSSSLNSHPLSGADLGNGCTSSDSKFRKSYS
jgi:hypothetical protein